MASFFEKLKKGMGVEEETAEEETPAEPNPVKKKAVRRRKAKATATQVAATVQKPKRLAIKEVSLEEEEPEEEETPMPETSAAPEEEPGEEEKTKWFDSEGQLAIDVYQTANELVVQSAIAGINPDSLDIIMENDVITVKGMREKPFEEQGDYFAQECFWGPFSREIILPVEVDPNRASAEMKEGVLTIRIPKIMRDKKRKIVVRSA